MFNKRHKPSKRKRKSNTGPNLILTNSHWSVYSFYSSCLFIHSRLTIKAWDDQLITTSTNNSKNYSSAHSDHTRVSVSVTFSSEHLSSSLLTCRCDKALMTSEFQLSGHVICLFIYSASEKLFTRNLFSGCSYVRLVRATGCNNNNNNNHNNNNNNNNPAVTWHREVNV